MIDVPKKRSQITEGFGIRNVGEDPGLKIPVRRHRYPVGDSFLAKVTPPNDVGPKSPGQASLGEIPKASAG